MEQSLTSPIALPSATLRFLSFSADRQEPPIWSIEALQSSIDDACADAEDIKGKFFFERGILRALHDIRRAFVRRLRSLSVSTVEKDIFRREVVRLGHRIEGASRAVAATESELREIHRVINQLKTEMKDKIADAGQVTAGLDTAGDNGDNGVVLRAEDGQHS